MLARLILLSKISTLCLVMAFACGAFAAEPDMRADVTATAMTSAESSDVLSAPRFTLSVDPIYFFEHGFGAAADLPLTQTLSVGLDGFMIFDHSDQLEASTGNIDYKWSEYELMLRTQYMITHSLATDGLYVMGGIGVLNAHIRNFSDYMFEGDTTAAIGRATAGYQWVIQRVKLTLGAGYEYYQNPYVSVRDNQGNETEKVNTASTNIINSSKNSGLVFDAAIGFNF